MREADIFACLLAVEAKARAAMLLNSMGPGFQAKLFSICTVIAFIHLPEESYSSSVTGQGQKEGQWVYKASPFCIR